MDTRLVRNCGAGRTTPNVTPDGPRDPNNRPAVAARSTFERNAVAADAKVRRREDTDRRVGCYLVLEDVGAHKGPRSAISRPTSRR